MSTDIFKSNYSLSSVSGIMKSLDQMKILEKSFENVIQGLEARSKSQTNIVSSLKSEVYALLASEMISGEEIETEEPCLSIEGVFREISKSHMKVSTLIQAHPENSYNNGNNSPNGISYKSKASTTKSHAEPTSKIEKGFKIFHSQKSVTPSTKWNLETPDVKRNPSKSKHESFAQSSATNIKSETNIAITKKKEVNTKSKPITPNTRGSYYYGTVSSKSKNKPIQKSSEEIKTPRKRDNSTNSQSSSHESSYSILHKKNLSLNKEGIVKEPKIDNSTKLRKQKTADSKPEYITDVLSNIYVKANSKERKVAPKTNGPILKESAFLENLNEKSFQNKIPKTIKNEKNHFFTDIEKEERSLFPIQSARAPKPIDKDNLEFERVENSINVIENEEYTREIRKSIDEVYKRVWFQPSENTTHQYEETNNKNEGNSEDSINMNKQEIQTQSHILDTVRASIQGLYQNFQFNGIEIVKGKQDNHQANRAQFDTYEISNYLNKVIGNVEFEDNKLEIVHGNYINSNQENFEIHKIIQDDPVEGYSQIEFFFDEISKYIGGILSNIQINQFENVSEEIEENKEILKNSYKPFEDISNNIYDQPEQYKELARKSIVNLYGNFNFISNYQERESTSPRKTSYEIIEDIDEKINLYFSDNLESQNNQFQENSEIQPQLNNFVPFDFEISKYVSNLFSNIEQSGIQEFVEEFENDIITTEPNAEPLNEIYKNLIGDQIKQIYKNIEFDYYSEFDPIVELGQPQNSGRKSVYSEISSVVSETSVHELVNEFNETFIWKSIENIYDKINFEFNCNLDFKEKMGIEVENPHLLTERSTGEYEFQISNYLESTIQRVSLSVVTKEMARESVKDIYDHILQYADFSENKENTENNIPSENFVRDSISNIYNLASYSLNKLVENKDNNSIPNSSTEYKLNQEEENFIKNSISNIYLKAQETFTKYEGEANAKEINELVRSSIGNIYKSIESFGIESQIDNSEISENSENEDFESLQEISEIAKFNTNEIIRKVSFRLSAISRVEEESKQNEALFSFSINQYISSLTSSMFQ